MSEKQFEKDKVSVVITVYNEERFLRQTLESVVNQVDCVIIGDNASTDGTEAICREFAEKYPHVLYFRHKQNNGCIINTVSCYEKVETEYVFLMGSHDLLSDGYVEELKKLLNADSEAICAFADVINFSSSKKDKKATFPLSASVLKDFKSRDPYFRALRYVSHGGPFPWVPVHGLFRSEIFLPIGRKWVEIDNEQAILFECLLHGTFLHSPNTTFRRRNNHLEKTGDEYYDDLAKRVYGKTNPRRQLSYKVNELHLYEECVLTTYQNFNNEKYLASKEKYFFPLKFNVSKKTGTKVGHFFYDLILMRYRWKIQWRYWWRNSTIRVKWKAFTANLKKMFQ